MISERHDEAMPRLALKPDVPSTGYINGAWWPHSGSLAAELPPLLTALADVVGEVVLVGYHVSGWDESPLSLDFEGRVVQLERFSTEAPHTVLVIGADSRRIALLVVPPEAAGAAAQFALSAASRPVREAGDEAEDDATGSLAELADRLSSRDGANERRTALIGQWVDEAAEQFAHAPVQNYVPILVEHIVRGRLAASSASGSR